MTISGLDKLTKQLSEAEKALSNVDGDLAHVSFDPEDPASIEAAIQELYRIIDTKVGSYNNNALIDQLVGGLKEQGRQAILDKAAATRLKGDGE
tara:strand:- start:932 stop:1213 length:282 start_codon:yes stop_codon:yes gene_type:complete